MEYEDEIWVDEAKWFVNTYKTSDPLQITECLREMFNAHSDVYTLLLAFLRSTGHSRVQKSSVVRFVLTEFKEWFEELKEKPKLVKNYLVKFGRLLKNTVICLKNIVYFLSLCFSIFKI